MKNLSCLIIFIMLLSACSIQNSKNIYRVSVLDLETNQPIDSAKIVLVAIVDAIDIYKQIGYTDKNGNYEFKAEYPDRAQIKFVSSKTDYHYYQLKNNDGKSLGYYFLKNNSEKDITLYLTKKDLDEFVPRPENNIDSIVEQLITNRYCSRCFLPELEWKDIPRLLEIANNTNKINKYPIHPASSMWPGDCYAGIVALWFIEYIRVSEQDPGTKGLKRFPYQRPQLVYLANDLSVINTKEQMLMAYSHYKNWWNNVKNMPSQNASMINPLLESDVRWKASLYLAK